MMLYKTDKASSKSKPAVVNGTKLKLLDGKRVWNAELINKGGWNELE